VSESSSSPTRDFTVAVLVVHDGKVLLHWHRKLGRWLPPGGLTAEVTAWCVAAVAAIGRMAP
jgi:hypothetical protein